MSSISSGGAREFEAQPTGGRSPATRCITRQESGEQSGAELCQSRLDLTHESGLRVGCERLAVRVLGLSKVGCCGRRGPRTPCVANSVSFGVRGFEADATHKKGPQRRAVVLTSTKHFTVGKSHIHDRRSYWALKFVGLQAPSSKSTSLMADALASAGTGNEGRSVSVDSLKLQASVRLRERTGPLAWAAQSRRRQVVMTHRVAAAYTPNSVAGAWRNMASSSSCQATWEL